MTTFSLDIKLFFIIEVIFFFFYLIYYFFNRCLVDYFCIINPLCIR